MYAVLVWHKIKQSRHMPPQKKHVNATDLVWLMNIFCCHGNGHVCKVSLSCVYNIVISYNVLILPVAI